MCHYFSVEGWRGFDPLIVAVLQSTVQALNDPIRHFKRPVLAQIDQLCRPIADILTLAAVKENYHKKKSTLKHLYPLHRYG